MNHCASKNDHPWRDILEDNDLIPGLTPGAIKLSPLWGLKPCLPFDIYFFHQPPVLVVCSKFLQVSRLARITSTNR